MRLSWTPEYRRAYRARRRAHICERERVWRTENKPKILKYRAKDYAENKEGYLQRAAKARALMTKDHPKYPEFLAKQRQTKRRAKMRLFSLFGNCCGKCGFSDERALQLDHVNADPLPKSTGLRGGEKLYRKLLNGDISLDGFQLLCANCNSIKRFENGEGCHKRDVALSPDIVNTRWASWQPSGFKVQ